MSALAPPPTFLQVQALCVKHGQRYLFKGINFRVQAGELVQVCGNNGAGKTTLLRTLLGLQKPHQGQITWSCAPADRLYLGHKLGLKADLTVSENLAFLQRLQRHTKPQLSLPFYPLDTEDKPLHKLSAGQQRRCSLSRVLLQNAKVWLLDEPFTALDQNAVTWMAMQITQHCRTGGSVLLSSHQTLPDCLSVTQCIAL